MKILSPRILLVLSILTISFIVIVFWSEVRVITRDTIYLVRPLWDKPGRHPEIVIPHFYANNISLENLCRLHNWTLREKSEIPTVIDTVIFSAEIDMLEIRLNELWNVVDKFIIIESNLTFTGKPKSLFLKNELGHRFKWAKQKLLYYTYDGLVSPLPDGESPFYNEIKMRSHMSSIITDSKIGVQNGDLIIESDVDEIPSRNTIQLLKSCKGYPNGLHLEMRNYLYSFEFYMNRENWKPHICIYHKYNFFYHHGWTSNFVLADAGWHCSFCFRYLSQFIFKMLAYSHTDRVTSDKLLLKENIQEKICRGADIFDMFPEGYTYKELISKMGDIPKTDSTLNIPEFIVQNADKFKFLLPGGCKRENETVQDQKTNEIL